MLDCSSILAQRSEAAERSSANSPPPPAREGAPLEAPQEAPTIRIHSRFIPPSQAGLKTTVVLARGGCGHQHRRKDEKVKSFAWNVLRCCDVLYVVGVRACALLDDLTYNIVWNAWYLLLLHHRSYYTPGAQGSWLSPDNKTQKNKRKKKKNSEGTLLLHVVTGTRCQVLNPEKDPNFKRVQGRNARKISTAGGWWRYFSVQAGNSREEGTCENEH